MSHVWHLVRHDLRAHRAILLAWFAVCLAHPLFTLGPWSGQADRVAQIAAMLLVTARVVLAALAIAGFVQADSPIDDRAFWRTRPIPSGTMAAAHFLTVVSLFVLVPAVSVLGIAAALGLSPVHWPQMVAQVVATELACASLALVVATHTRSAATFLIGVVLVLGVVLMAPSVVEALTRVAADPGFIRSANQPSMAMMATVLVGALCLPPLYLLAMAGPPHRPLLTLASLGTLTLATSTWFLPREWYAAPALPQVRLDTAPPSIRVVEVPGGSSLRALVLDLASDSVHAGDSWRLTLERGQLTTPEGRRTLAHGLGGTIVPPPAVNATTAVLTMLSAEEHRRLTGTRTRLEATVKGIVARVVTEGVAALAGGATISNDHARFTLTQPPIRGASGYGTLGLTIRGREVAMEPATRDRHTHLYVLRDRKTACEVTLAYPRYGGVPGVTAAALLPTLARPFMASRIALEIVREPRCELEAARADIQMRTIDWVEMPPVSFSLEFAMPATGEAVTPVSSPSRTRPADRAVSQRTNTQARQGAA